MTILALLLGLAVGTIWLRWINVSCDLSDDGRTLAEKFKEVTGSKRQKKIRLQKSKRQNIVIYTSIIVMILSIIIQLIMPSFGVYIIEYIPKWIYIDYIRYESGKAAVFIFTLSILYGINRYRVGKWIDEIGTLFRKRGIEKEGEKKENGLWSSVDSLMGVLWSIFAMVILTVVLVVPMFPGMHRNISKISVSEAEIVFREPSVPSNAEVFNRLESTIAAAERVYGSLTFEDVRGPFRKKLYKIVFPKNNRQMTNYKEKAIDSYQFLVSNLIKKYIACNIEYENKVADTFKWREAENIAGEIRRLFVLISVKGMSKLSEEVAKVDAHYSANILTKAINKSIGSLDEFERDQINGSIEKVWAEMVRRAWGTVVHEDARKVVDLIINEIDRIQVELKKYESEIGDCGKGTLDKTLLQTEGYRWLIEAHATAYWYELADSLVAIFLGNGRALEMSKRDGFLGWILQEEPEFLARRALRMARKRLPQQVVLGAYDDAMQKWLDYEKVVGEHHDEDCKKGDRKHFCRTFFKALQYQKIRLDNNALYSVVRSWLEGTRPSAKDIAIAVELKERLSVNRPSMESLLKLEAEGLGFKKARLETTYWRIEDTIQMFNILYKNMQNTLERRHIDIALNQLNRGLAHFESKGVPDSLSRRLFILHIAQLEKLRRQVE